MRPTTRQHGEQILASNLHELAPDWSGPWEEPEALADVTVVAGALGIVVGLLAVMRLSVGHFPDTLFWRSVPLLLVIPPGCFLGALLAPGGLLDGDPAWSRAARLGLSGLASYLAPLLLLSLAASLGSLR